LQVCPGLLKLTPGKESVNTFEKSPSKDGFFLIPAGGKGVMYLIEQSNNIETR